MHFGGVATTEIQTFCVDRSGVYDGSLVDRAFVHYESNPTLYNVLGYLG